MRAMIRYFASRLLWAIPTLFVIVTAAFFLIRTAPGGPFDEERALPPAIKRNLEAAYGLDKPLWVQYSRYLRGVSRGDFGPTFRYKDFSVSELILQGLPVSMILGSISIVLALGLGVPIVIYAALHQNTAGDYGVMILAVAGITVPAFVVLPFLSLVFGIHLKWLPVAGWEPGAARYYVLPIIALALPPLAYVARLTRSSMIDVLNTPYIRTARAKGLQQRGLLWRHALRPALIPVAGFVAPAVAAIMTGSLVVESIAGLPGIGRYLVQGALNRDYTLVMGMVIIYSALLIGMGLLVDCVYVWLDPRIRFGQ